MNNNDIWLLNQVPTDKRLLWYFDPYMLCDMLCFQRNPVAYLDTIDIRRNPDSLSDIEIEEGVSPNRIDKILRLSTDIFAERKYLFFQKATTYGAAFADNYPLKLYQHYLNTSIYHRGSTLGDPPSPIFQDEYSLRYETNGGEVQLAFFESNLLPKYNQDEYTIQLPEGDGYVYFTCWIDGFPDINFNDPDQFRGSGNIGAFNTFGLNYFDYTFDGRSQIEKAQSYFNKSRMGKFDLYPKYQIRAKLGTTIRIPKKAFMFSGKVTSTDGKNYSNLFPSYLLFDNFPSSEPPIYPDYLPKSYTFYRHYDDRDKEPTIAGVVETQPTGFFIGAYPKRESLQKYRSGNVYDGDPILDLAYFIPNPPPPDMSDILNIASYEPEFSVPLFNQQYKPRWSFPQLDDYEYNLFNSVIEKYLSYDLKQVKQKLDNLPNTSYDKNDNDEVFTYGSKRMKQLLLLIDDPYFIFSPPQRFFGNRDDILGSNIPQSDPTFKRYSFLLTMSDRLLLEEIHACLGASEYATYEENGEQKIVYMHMARRLEDIAKALGLNFDLGGRIISLRQSKHVDQGETIPAGWSLGQFGRNEGGSKVGQEGGKEGEDRLGIVYEVKGNRFKTSASSGNEEIVQGGYVLCESLPQLLHVMLQDLDRSLGLQQLGSYVVANPNYNPNHSSDNEEFKTPYYTYNGLGQGLLDLLYLSQDTNRQASQANLGSLKAQAISQEILGALGLPVLEKNIMVGVDRGLAQVNYPGFNGEGMTIADLAFLILMNLAVQNEG